MYGFFIKKNFCDGWDNMFSLLVPNLVILCVIAGFAALAYAVRDSMAAAMVIIFIAVIVVSILTLAYGDTAVKIANFSGSHIADYFKAVPGCIKDGALFGILNGVICAAAYICIPFYFSQKSLISIFVGALFAWAILFSLLALQWFVAVRSIMHNSFIKCIKKCFIIFFDNTGFSIFLAFYDLILSAFTVLFLGLMPSSTGFTLAQVNALRLRLYKYDYLEAHPEIKTVKERRIIPWDELIQDDKDALGPRSFKSFIFAWKE